MTYHFHEDTPGQNHGTALSPHVGKHILASEYVNNTHGNGFTGNSRVVR